MTVRAAASVKSDGNYPFLTLLRAFACLCVVYLHLGTDALGPTRHWWVSDTIQGWVLGPLGIIGSGAFFGVFVFFFISGFVITHVSMRETRTSFLVKRVLRIGPPLVLATTLAYLLVAAKLIPLARPYTKPYTPWHLLLNVTLVANILPRTITPLILGVTWTLVIEVLFYIAMWLVLPLLRTRPLIAALTLLAAVVIATVVYPWIPGSPLRMPIQHLIQFMVDVTILLIGQAIYLVVTSRISTRWFAGLVVLDLAAYIFGYARISGPKATPVTDWLISIGWALGVFVLGLVLHQAGYLRRIPKPILRLGDMSYSLYLVHIPVGYAILRQLRWLWPAPHAPLYGEFTVPFLLMVGGALGVATVSWLLVERPSQRLARVLLRRMAPSRVSREHPKPATVRTPAGSPASKVAAGAKG